MPRITRTQNDCLWRQVSMFVAFSFGRCEKGEAGKQAKKKPKMLTKWHKLFNFLGWWVGRRRKLDIFAFFFHLKNMIFTFRRAPGRAGGRYKKSFCLKRRTDLKTKHERKSCVYTAFEFRRQEVGIVSRWMSCRTTESFASTKLHNHWICPPFDFHLKASLQETQEENKLQEEISSRLRLGFTRGLKPSSLSQWSPGIFD